MHLAAQDSSSAEVVRVLLAAGGPGQLTAKSKDGRTPKDLVEWRRH